MASDVANVLLKLIDVANPLAGAAAEFIAGKLGLSDKTTDAIKQTIAGADPVELEKIRSELQDHLASFATQVQLAQVDADKASVVAVNSTLQADARGDSWLQKNHHAIESLTTTFLVVGVYFGLPITGVPVPSIPEAAFIMLGSVLGVTAWQHGQVNQKIAIGNN